MATIKAIETGSVHQIQSGQVIVDLCSVVKELVENSLDAGATSIEIRFKNQGLDSIEVQDNGNGIAPEDFETVALKHYTSKLSSYEDISELDTFGFRGEALSSLCALSKFHILTARGQDGAVGKKLDFDVSGKLKGTAIAAAPKGTTVSVEELFYNLPVRRKELDKNIKREYGKVVSLLHAYACISVGVRFSVSNQMPKGKKLAVFSTKSNPKTKENITNVFGAKTIAALIDLDLHLEMEPSTGGGVLSSRKSSARSLDRSLEVHVQGHISKPVFGEGRQAPDRQMFFVNSRPCLLPQVTKAFNEVYKSFNLSQSPFVFANLVMDTNAYDVNVSPDKRTILLHDQTAMLEQLKTALTELFEETDHTVPLSALPNRKLPAFSPLTLQRQTSTVMPLPSKETTQDSGEESHTEGFSEDRPPASSVNLIQQWVGKDIEDRQTIKPGRPAAKESNTGRKNHRIPFQEDESDENSDPALNAGRSPEQASLFVTPERENHKANQLPLEVQDFNAAMTNARNGSPGVVGNYSVQKDAEEPIRSIMPSSQKSTPGPVQSAFDRMRPRRLTPEVAKITVGDETITTVIGSAPFKKRRIRTPEDANRAASLGANSRLAFGLRAQFSALGSQLRTDTDDLLHREQVDVDEDDPEVELDDTDSQDEDVDEEFVDAELPQNPTDERPQLKNWSADDPRNSTGMTHLPADEDDTDERSISQDEVDENVIHGIEKSPQDEGETAQMGEETGMTAVRSNETDLRRANQVLKTSVNEKTATVHYCQTLETTVATVEADMQRLYSDIDPKPKTSDGVDQVAIVDEDLASAEAESRLSLTVTKADFDRMHIIGQFNLGFILATRAASNPDDQDDLFIIDQHAADEKYNYERLQKTVTLQSQRLVHPKLLELTAVEEETILNHPDALKANGFEVETTSYLDEASESSGRHCHLLTLPMSQEKTFEISDLEELLHLLSEQPPGSTSVPRPRKVQKMLAMRACRSSIMVGRTLTPRQMERVVRHMGEMEKPWNCPHGRPTMRHLAGLTAWSAWREGDVVDGEEGEAGRAQSGRGTDWDAWLGGLSSKSS